MLKINTYVMPIHTSSGATVSSGKLAMKQRVARLKRELRINVNALNNTTLEMNYGTLSI